jgi:hypothetical protein
MPSGSKSGSRGTGPWSVSQVPDEAGRLRRLLDPLGRGQPKVLLEELRVMIVARSEANAEVEAAGHDELGDRLHAGSGGTPLEPRDDRLRGPDPFGELSLGEPRPLPRLSNEMVSLHEASIAELLYASPSDQAGGGEGKPGEHDEEAGHDREGGNELRPQTRFQFGLEA